MPDFLKVLRSTIAGHRPSGRAFGEPYVNFADAQFGVLNQSNNPQDLIGVPFFSTLASYTSGQPVNYQGQLYVALGAVAPGAWNPAQWSAVQNQVTAVSGFANRLRNGSFAIWQRGTTLNTSGAYTADGWYVAANVAVQIIANSGGGAPYNSMQIIGQSGITACSVWQRIPADVTWPLGGIPATIQFAITNNSGAAFTPQLQIDHATALDTFSTTANDLPATNLQPCPNGATTVVAYTFQVPAASANLGLQFTLLLGNSLAGSGKNIVVQNADLRGTRGLPVGLCSNPPLPQLYPFPVELFLCQRFFEKTYDLPTKLGTPTNTYLSGQYLQVLGGNSLGISCRCPFKVTKHHSPTVAVYSNTSGNANYFHDANSNADVVANIYNSGLDSFSFYGYNAATSSQGINWSYHWSALSEL